MLERAVIVAMIVMAIHAVFIPGMIFGFVRKLFENAPEWVKNPLFDCPVCMTPWWGFLAYSLFFGVGWNDFVAVIMAAMGINFLLSMLMQDE